MIWSRTSHLCKTRNMLASQIYTVFDIEDSDYLVRETTWNWTTIQFMILTALFIIALLVFIFAALSIARSVRRMAVNSERLLTEPMNEYQNYRFTQGHGDTGHGIMPSYL